MKMNSHDQYYWIMEHPAFSNDTGYDIKIEITPHMVCPETDRIENYSYLNIQKQFWVELSYPVENNMFCHDWDLDCGGNTWDDAVDALYTKVLEKYGDYDPKQDEYSVQELENFSQQWTCSDDTYVNRYEGLSVASLNLEFEVKYSELKQETNTLEVLKKYLARKYSDKVQIRIDMDKIEKRIKSTKQNLEDINNEYKKIGEVPKEY